MGFVSTNGNFWFPIFLQVCSASLEVRLAKLQGTWRAPPRCQRRLGQGQETHLRSLVNEINSFLQFRNYTYFSHLNALYNIVSKVSSLVEVSNSTNTTRGLGRNVLNHQFHQIS